MCKIYSGTSGVLLPVRKSEFPTEFQGRTGLAYYASLFNSVEINSSFYKLPRASTVEKWAQAVPEMFRFTFKLSKSITHIPDLLFNATDVHDFMQTINYCAEKNGCVLIQLPPRLRVENFTQLEKLLSTIKKYDPLHEWKLAVEFRHLSWYTLTVMEMLRKFQTTIVVHDIPASATPLDLAGNDFVYLRFHGIGGRYRGSYSNECLRKYAGYINEWASSGKPVYIYFNNTIGDAIKNLRTLNEYVSRLKNSLA